MSAATITEDLKSRFKRYLKYVFHDFRARENGLTKFEVSSFLVL